MTRLRFLSLVLAMAGLMVSACGKPDTDLSWSQWRGADGSGITEKTDLPLHWRKDGAGIKWAAELDGAGTSSPVVAGGQVFVTSATTAVVGKPIEINVESFDLASGELGWRTTIATRNRERMHRMNSSAGPTPASDGEHLFAYVGSHLAALTMDGDIVWVQEIDPNYLAESRYGAGSSVLLYGDMVVILRDRERVDDALVGWMAAYDKASGEQVWRKKIDDSCCSYVTPLVIEGAAGDELFVVLAGYVASYDPASGKRLWRRKQEIAQPVASPVAEGDLLCVASGAHGHRQARCWEKVTEDDQTVWRDLWKHQKWVGDTSSPVLVDGRLYLLTEKGILRSIDARTGKLLWQKRLAAEGYRASLVAGESRLYALGQAGSVSVVSQADGETLAVNSMPEATYVASPGVAGECLLIRSNARLYCVGGTDAPAPAGS
ncbi:MAG: PQQ-binding-like beta-propeller repeat protein [Thermoanaerobaculia bacterium]